MSKNSKPEISLSNWQELETYYTQQEPKPKTARKIARLMAIAFRPKVVLTPGAQEALSSPNGNALTSFIPNHVSEADPLNLATGLWRTPITRHLIERAAIPSKTDVLNIHPLIRWATEAVGTYINYGKRDLDREPEAAGELFDLAKASSMRLNTHMMLTRETFGIYIAGTRGKQPLVVDPPKDGYATSLLEIGDRRQVNTYPVGTFYGAGVNPRPFSLNWFHPVMVVGPPITSYSSDIAEINGVLHSAQQQYLDEAVKLSTT